MLKVIALILMFIDHLGLSLFPNLLILRIIGRLSYPIFAFSLVEGYIYTRNRNNYFKRLIIFAVVSMLPFSLLMGGVKDFNTAIYIISKEPLKLFIGRLDIGFTLSLGFISLMIVDRIKSDKRNIFNYIGLIFTLILAKVIGVDYGIYGVLSIVLIYICREHKWWLILSFILLPITMININHLSIDPIFQIFAVFSIPIIFALKDNDFAKGVKLPRWFFYVFYPVHIAILWIIRCI